VDIPADLIREHLTEATRYTDELRSFDPYAGNVLESVVASDANDKKHTYLAFPMGELKSDLSQFLLPFMLHVLSYDFQTCRPFFVLKVNLSSSRP